MIFCNELTIDGQGQICLTVCFPLLFTVVGADPPASQKTLENPSLAGALQFCRSRNLFSQGKPLDHTCRMVKGLDAVWATFCPLKPRSPSFIGGKKQVGQPLPGNQKYSEGRPGYVFGLDVGWIVRSGSRCCTGCACKCSLTPPATRHQAPTARSVPPPIPR